MKPRRRRRRSRLLVLLLGLLLLEVALQAVAPLVRRAMTRADGPPPADAAFTVLCVGDSNTYGLHLPRAFAYPALLEQLLARRFTGPIAVVNRGIPGQNSAQTVAGLEQDLPEVAPDLVLILVGINDTWNAADEEDALWVWLGRLKLVRLVRVLAAGVTTTGRFDVHTDAQGEFVVDRGEGERRVNVGEKLGTTRSGEALHASVRGRLTRAVELCRDAGARPVLLTYAEFQGDFAVAADAARAVAAEQDVLLVDVQRIFLGHFAEHGYENLMFGDHHPNAAGYRLMAQALDVALAEAGYVPTHSAAGPRVLIEQAPLRRPSLRVQADGTLLAEGPAGWIFQILASGLPDDWGASDSPSDVSPAHADAGAEQERSAEADAEEARRSVERAASSYPLRQDEALVFSRLVPFFNGRLDAAGRSPAIPVPPRLRSTVPGPLAACVLLLHDPDPTAPDGAGFVAAVSEVIRVP